MADQLSLTLPQLQKRLSRIERPMPVGLVTITTPAMRKKNNPFFGRVIKISHVTAWINFRYSKSVNRQRIREHKPADFRALERSWGERIQKTPLVEYGQQWYLDLKIERRLSQLRDVKTGQIIDPKALAPFVRPVPKNRRQHLNVEVILRDYRLDHIAEIRIDGQVWRIRKPWNQLQKLLAKGMAA